MRPKNGEKKAQIVAAFIESVAAVGLENSSMGEVAARVGLDRTTLHYYFRTRDALIVAAVDALSERYLTHFNDALASFGTSNRGEKLADYLFGGGFHQPDLSVVIEEFGVYANRDPAIDRRISSIYRRVENMLLAEVGNIFPQATAKARREVTFAISQLLEGYTVFVSMGFGADRARAAHRAALILLDALRPAAKSNSRRAETSNPRRLPAYSRQ